MRKSSTVGAVLLAASVPLTSCRNESVGAPGPTPVRVVNLRTEYQQNPIGIDMQHPRLSWQLQALTRDVRQSAYQFRIAGNERDVRDAMRLLFDSGKVASDQSTQLQYSGPALQSRHQYYWQVRVWDAQGRSTDWSDPAHWEMGLLSKTDWQAHWIEPPADLDPRESAPAPLLRSEFTLQDKIVRARAYATSLGVYELYLNGKRVSDALFTPGWTSYEKRLQYQTYDVSALLNPGNNAVGAVLGDGWYRRVSFNAGGKLHNNGKPLALLVQIEVAYENGETQTILSNPNWKTATGPILLSELYNGEVYDARLERSGWASAGHDDRQWSRVRMPTAPGTALIATVGPPVRRIEELTPLKVFKTPAGDTIVDMGQNMVGWVRLRVRGERGTTVTLRHAEVLDRQGNFYTANLRSAQQMVQYTLKGEGEEVFEPHFTSQGFRYVAVAGFPGEIQPGSLTGIVIHSDVERTGTFETSDELVNQLQHNIVWVQKGNYLEVSTDCPQRDERLGWTGSALPILATAAFNTNVANFFTKWLGDLSVDQTADGAVPWEVPRTLFDKIPERQILQSGGRDSDSTRALDAVGAAAWGDAATIVPWTLYLAYGDIAILEAQYESMVRWVQYQQTRAGDDFIWSEDLTFGDWLDFDSTLKTVKFGATPEALLSTAYYAHSADLVRKAARVLGKDADAARYGALFERIRAAFNQHFVSTDGRVGAGTQTAYALALEFDLLPPALRPAAARHLADDVRSRGHLTTGIIGTQYLLEVLTRFGYVDEAYLLLNRREMPSWLYQVVRGATTIWERWDGIKPDGSFQNPEMNSFNQGELGSVGAWMYRVMAGIDIDPAAPGYKHSLIQPLPGGGFTYVKGSLETMYGRLSSEWRLENARFTLDVEIPPNTRSTVRLPRATLAQVQESGRPMRDVADIASARQQDRNVLVELGSGKYRFSYPWNAR